MFLFFFLITDIIKRNIYCLIQVRVIGRQRKNLSSASNLQRRAAARLCADAHATGDGRGLSSRLSLHWHLQTQQDHAGENVSRRQIVMFELKKF